MAVQKKCWWIAVILFLLLLAIRLIPDWNYHFGIYKNGIRVSRVHVSHTTRGLTGCEISFLDVDHSDPDRILIHPRGFCSPYISEDHGNTWTMLQYPFGRVQSALWINGFLVAVVSDNDTFKPSVQISRDHGKSWQKVANSRFQESSTMELRRNDAYSPYLIVSPAQGNSPDEAYLLSIRDNDLHETPSRVNVPRLRQGNAEKTTIRFERGEVKAKKIMVSDGAWAVTEGGPFFQAKGTLHWEDHGSALHFPTLKMIEKSPGDIDHLLTYDTIGRLWTSADRGNSWTLSRARDVDKAVFLPDHSIFIVHLDKSVEILKKGKLTDITPDWMGFIALYNSDPSQRQATLNDLCIYSLGGNEDELWIATGLFFDISPFSLIPLTEAHYDLIQKELSEFSGRARPHTFVYTRKNGTWRREPIEKLRLLEPTREICHFNVQDKNLYIGKIPMPKTKYISWAGRVRLLDNGTKYLWADDSTLQIGTLKNCKPDGIARFWNFDEMTIDKSTVFLNSPDKLEGISIAAACDHSISRFEIKLDSPPLYKRFLHFFFFSHGALMMFLVLGVWRWKIGKS